MEQPPNVMHILKIIHGYPSLYNAGSKGWANYRFQDAVGSNPAISLRDPYYTLAAHTSGSHVKVYNVPNYGNVYSSSMAEYLSRK